MGREDPMGGSVRVDLYGLSRAQDGGAAILGDRLMGTCVGDSRMYVIPEVGPPRIPTEGAAKGRLGSGPVRPFLVHERLKAGNLLLLMSDGAWTPLSLAKLQALRLQRLQGHPSDVPALILDASGRGGPRGRHDGGGGPRPFVSAWGDQRCQGLEVLRALASA